MPYNANPVQMISGTAKYVAAGDGASIAAFNFKDAAGNALQIPASCMIVGGGLQVQKAVTSGGSATVQVKVGSTALTGLLAVAALSAGSGHDLTTSVVNSAAAALTWSVATAALTDGIAHVYVLYVQCSPNATI